MNDIKSKPLIECRGLSRTFVMGDRSFTVLNDITLSIYGGERFSLVGPSGAGKSTLLHILGSLDTPSSGQVFFKGVDLFSMPSRERDMIRNRSFGFVFQFYHLIPELNVIENTILPRMISTGFFKWPITEKKYIRKAEEILTTIGLKDRIRHKVTRLSGGEKQRVAIARALMNDPEILFCDEPTGNLDTQLSSEIQKLLWKISRDFGMSIFMATHNSDLAAMADRKIRLVDGTIDSGYKEAVS